MPTPFMTFLGAAGTVTGSKFLVETDRAAVLIEAGLYQGLANLRRRNWEGLSCPADRIDAVVLTHAHLDHCGYLPRLVKDGFSGPVICTEGTADLVEIVLRDSAHLQEEDARLANAGGYSKHHPALPLYDGADVETALDLLRPLDFHQRADLADGVAVELQPAGHILGSATVLAEADGRRAVFSGDLGPGQHPILLPPEPPAAAGTVVVESTYGDRLHPAPDSERLAAAIRRTAKRGGSVLIPAFAVDRTELVLLSLHELLIEDRIPRLPVYVDSPMALATLEVYRRALRSGSAEIRPDVARVAQALDALEVRAVRHAEDSMRLNSPRHPCIIVSASGMATGGRVIHHLAHQLPDRHNTVVLTGYQAVGTRGRQLQDGAAQVKIHGRYVPVRAEVVDVPDYSVHADASSLVEWLAGIAEPPDVVYVVHGEAESSAALATRIREELGWCAVVPRHEERVLLT